MVEDSLEFAPHDLSMERMQKNASEATILLKSIANETRLMIICQLTMGEKSVASLLETTPLSQSALSQHLTILRRERLVVARKEAQSVFYSLASKEVRAIIETLYNIYCGPDCGA
ncbi:MAG: regulatory protein ArsR [Hyphomonadaceae bacterium]|nr:MAG: regulatory protein ArsR [Hyphomonadaceae bacterium]KAF0183611.1 MAG: regulatory protein ArsR [Hyphomonadaceae bacterium]